MKFKLEENYGLVRAIVSIEVEDLDELMELAGMAGTVVRD